MADVTPLSSGCLKTTPAALIKQEPVIVQVVDVFRYMIDESFPFYDDYSQGDLANFPDAFDVLITDGHWKTKCLLSPKHNHLVYGHELAKNTVIEVLGFAEYVDETVLGGKLSDFCILREMHIIATEVPSMYLEPSNLEFPVGTPDRERNQVPLTTFRDYYLPLWNSEDYFGSRWKVDTNLTLNKHIDSAITISDLSQNWDKLYCPFPALIGRIVAKSRLSHIGIPASNSPRDTYHASLDLIDRSGLIHVNISGGQFCPLVFRCFQLDDIVAVSRYYIKMNETKNNVPVEGVSTKPISVELSDNIGEIWKLDPADVNPLLKVPQIKDAYGKKNGRMFLRMELYQPSMAGTCFDVLGVVTFVGRNERKKKANAPGFWMYRWIHLRNAVHLKDQLIPLKLYSCSQPYEIESIKPGKVLFCTGAQLLKEYCSPKEHLYLQSTVKSMVYVLENRQDVEGKPFCNRPEVEEVMSWKETDDAKELLKQACLSGYYSFPPIPNTLNTYQRLSTDKNPFKLVNTECLEGIFSGMHYMQHLRLAIQGTVAALEFVNMLNTNKASVDHNRESTHDVVSSNKNPDKQSETIKKPDEKKSLELHDDMPMTRSRAKKIKDIQEKQEDERPSKSKNDEEYSRSLFAASQSATNTMASRIQPSEAENTGQKNPPIRYMKDSGYYHSVATNASAKRTVPTTKTSVSSQQRACELRNSKALKSSSGTHGRKQRPKKQKKKRLVRKARSCQKQDAERTHGERIVNCSALEKRETGTAAAVSNLSKRGHDRWEESIPFKKSKPQGDSLCMGVGQVRTGNSPSKYDVLCEKTSTAASESTTTEEYFPFKILDSDWEQNASEITTLGMASVHSNTFPVHCAGESREGVMLPTANRQGFVFAGGYWRLLIVGLNRRVAVNAFLMLSPGDGVVRSCAGESDGSTEGSIESRFRYQIQGETNDDARRINKAPEENRDRDEQRQVDDDTTKESELQGGNERQDDHVEGRRIEEGPENSSTITTHGPGVNSKQMVNLPKSCEKSTVFNGEFSVNGEDDKNKSVQHETPGSEVQPDVASVGDIDNGVFLSALSSGTSSGITPRELLQFAQEEMTSRRTVFILDVYCHGRDDVEVVLNKAY